MSNHYKKFLRLLEKWPVDKTKQGRDLGQNLRDQLQQILGGSSIITVNDSKLDSQFQSLENLVNNVYQKKYPRRFKSTSSGLTGEQCRQVLSSEFLEYLNEDKKKITCFFENSHSCVCTEASPAFCRTFRERSVVNLTLP